MSPEYLQSFDLLMQFETGAAVNATGLVNDPSDPGGLTKFGISQKSYPDLNIASLTRDDARDIYYRDFWAPYFLDRICIKSRHLAERIFVMGVLIGMSKIIKITQAAINLLSDDSIAIDGKMGAATIMAIQGIKNSSALTAAHKILTGQHLLAIGQKRFLAGWLVRNEAA